jgi:hypothetical protein
MDPDSDPDADADPDPAVFVSGLLLFEGTFSSFFKNKRIKQVTKQ